MFEQKYIFVYIPFQANIIQVFKDFKYVIQVNGTPEAFLSVHFGLFREKFVTSFIYSEIKRQIMEEVCEVTPKPHIPAKPAKEISELKNFSRHERFLFVTRCRGSLFMSTPKPDNYMLLS